MRRAVLALVVLALIALAWWAFGSRTGAVEPIGATPGSVLDPTGTARVASGSDRMPEGSDEPTTTRRTAIEDATRGRGTLRVRLLTADGAAPVPCAAVHVVARDGRSDGATLTIGVTDDRGDVRFERLDAGPWAVTTDRAVAGTEPKSVEVRDGDLVEVTLRAAPGVDAVVRVLDRAGGRVPGAEVTLWAASGHLDVPTDEPGNVVGTTDANGELALRALPYLAFGSHSSWVAARHPVLGSSAARMVPAPEGADDRAARIVELGLGLAGGSIEVRVTDRDGGALLGARVTARPTDEPGSKAVGRERALSHVFRARLTDGSGLAVLGPLPDCGYLLQVSAAGHAPFREALRVTASELVVRDVQLAPEARVHGVVTDRSGAPVGGATVTVQQQRTGGSVTSGPDGTFRLGQLAPGAAEWVARHEAFLERDGEVALLADDDVAIAVVLDPLARIRLRLVDDAGAGVEGLGVAVTSKLPGFATDERRGRTDAEGRVELRARDDLRYRLLVHQPGLFVPLPVPDPGEIGTSEEERIVRVPDAARATAFVEGTLIDGADRPAIEGVFIAVAGHGRIAYPGSTMAAAETDPATGWFRLGPLPPGDYELHVTDRSRLEFSVPGVVLRPHATTNVGTVRAPASGTVAVELEVDPGVMLADLSIQLDGTATSDIAQVDTKTLRATKAMLPGHYRLTVYGSNFRWLHGAIDVVAGETVTFRGTLYPAVRVGLRFHMPEGEDGVTFEVRDARGELVFDVELETGVQSEDWWPFFDRGAFFVTAVGASGKRYATRFTVESLERSETPIDIRGEPVR